MNNPPIISDPALELAKVAVFALKLLFAFFAGIGTLAAIGSYQGYINDWKIKFIFYNWEYQPQPNSIFWHTFIFSLVTIICTAVFFGLKWLEKKIKMAA
jgi:uncharacterized membrane protein